MINPLVFRKYDIRGVVDKDLQEDSITAIGKAFGTYVLDRGKKDVILGRDNRPSSKFIRDVLSKAIRSTGCNVFDIGEVPIPVYYFSIVQHNMDGGIYVTGSHNPPEYNGFKINFGRDSLFGEEIQKLKTIALNQEFKEGSGALDYLYPVDGYVKNIKDNITMSKRLKVVVDCGNGTSSLIAPKLLEELGCETIRLYCDSDGTFPNHLPDPTIPENLADLQKTVLKENADLGVAYDGDGDRIGVIDNKGNIIWGDKLLVLFSRELLKNKPKSKILVEVKCSQCLIEDIKSKGGMPVLCPTGHSIIKDKMKQEGAELAGEMSGHIFFADEYFGFDDAIYSTCRLLRILSNSDNKLTEMLSDVKKYYSTPEIRIDCKDQEKFFIMEELKKYFSSKYDVIDIDGVRILFENGWALIRPSNTEPKLILRFESETEQGLNQIKNKVIPKLKEHLEVEGF